MLLHRRVPILFQLEYFDRGIFLCAYAGGKNFIFLQHHFPPDINSYCKDFFDYSGGFSCP